MPTATQPVVLADGIDSEVINLILHRNYFYGHFLQQFKRHMIAQSDPMAKTIKTMAVSITDDLKPNLYINQNFYSSMTTEQKLAVLEHEILHILNKHLLRAEERNHYIWNLATDLAINQYINNLPNGMWCEECCWQVQKGQKAECPICGKKLDPVKDVIKCLDINCVEIGEKKVVLEKDKASELYYDVLWEKMPKMIVSIGTAMTAEKEQGAKGAMGGQGQQQGQGQPQQGAGGSGANGNVKVGPGWVEIDGQRYPAVFDNHEVWETGSDNKEMAHEKIKSMVAKAREESDARSQGTMPGWLQSLINKCLAHKTVNWKSELRKFVGYEEFADFVSSRKRPNRRFFAMPGYRVLRKAEVWVVLDSSGSISEKEFAKFFREVEAMAAARVTVTLIDCDADIAAVYPFKKKPSQTRHGYGGTDFRPPFHFLNKLTYKNGQGKIFTAKKRPDALIYLTDGCGSFPDKKDITVPTMWVLCDQHNDYGWKDEYGKRIVMDKD
jgi:predicted metal-dependent peptidase